MLVAIYIGFDLPLTFLNTSGANYEYGEHILLGFGLLFSLINIRRSIKRWMGLIIVSKAQKFKWSGKISETRKSRVITYTVLEAVVMACVAYGLYQLTPFSWLASAGLLYGTLDNVIFLFIGLKKFSVGLTSKAVIVADREVVVLYFKGLRKVSVQQQTVYFDYIKGIQLRFPYDCIKEDERKGFMESLENQLDLNTVFVSKKI